MVEQLLIHIERHQLCKTTDKILLAVSGGVDSMVMLDLFRHAGFSIGVAHCNFQLRGEDALADEVLVQRVCALANIPFHSSRFNTSEFAVQHGLPIQLAARELRYDFFETLAREHGYPLVATAHHLNDSIETTLVNFIRGTGVQGLAGIPVKNGRIIRPMLFATREQILDYAKRKTLEWREDSTNASDEYQRNFIRHKITPLLMELNPNFENTFQKTSERISGAIEINQTFLDKFRTLSIEKRQGEEWISLSQLRKVQHAAVLLWELVKSKGFNYDQCSDVMVTTHPGKQFLSSTHRLIVDREFLILSPLRQHEIVEVLIESEAQSVYNGTGDEIHILKNEKPVIDQDPAVAVLDASKIVFPLRWRKWEAGDAFQPLGMNSTKKLSDFLIDAKIPSSAKENVTVIESSGKILWVVGMRISDDAKITSATSAAIILKVAKTEGEKIS